jgi:hypothetical protein
LALETDGLKQVLYRYFPTGDARAPHPKPEDSPLHVDPDVTYPTFNPEKLEETETPAKIRYLSYGFLFSTVGFSLISYLRNLKDRKN